MPAPATGAYARGTMGRRIGAIGAIRALAALAALMAGAAPIEAAGGDAREVELAEHGLTLTLPPLAELAPAPGTHRWRGRLEPSLVEITFKTLASERYGFAEPEDVLELGPSFWSSPEHERNAPGARRALSGPYGYASYACIDRIPLVPRGGGAPIGVRFLFAGLLPAAGYWITVEASPAPTPEGEAVLLEFLEQGVRYAGAVREHRWTDAEANERWRRDVPSALHEKLAAPIRTAHYLVLTNSSGGAAFAKKMEECHAAIRKVYPFDDVPGRKLLPVFLFRTDEEYFQFYAAIAGIERDEAARSKGHAWRDYYATWYDAPGDPVHIHEATHQIFSNRLNLGGGGSWFQEGVAEYMSSKPGDRSAVAGRVKKEKHMPLAEFVTIPSLLMSSDEDAPGGDSSGDNYDQAALLIEFLRESKWAKDKFPLFLWRMGHAGDGQLAEIESVIEDIYDVDLAGLEQRWIEYCKKR